MQRWLFFWFLSFVQLLIKTHTCIQNLEIKWTIICCILVKLTKAFTFKITCNVQKRTDEHIFWLWLFYHSPVHQLPKFYTNIHFCALDLELLMLKANFEPYCCLNCLNCWIYTYLFFGIFDNKPCDENHLQDWVFFLQNTMVTPL